MMATTPIRQTKEDDTLGEVSEEENEAHAQAEYVSSSSNMTTSSSSTSDSSSDTRTQHSQSQSKSNSQLQSEPKPQPQPKPRPQAQPPKKRAGGGVADYFAILGVGEKLVLKSTQKNNLNDFSGDNAKDDNDNGDEDDNQEEECAMMERFYREIVEIAFLTVYSPSSTDGNEANPIANVMDTGTITTSNSYDYGHTKSNSSRSNGSGFNYNYYPYDDTDGFADFIDPSFSPLSRSYTMTTNYTSPSPIPTPPTKVAIPNIRGSVSLSNTAAINKNPGANNGQSQNQQHLQHVNTNYAHTEIAGYKILWNTVPAGQSSADFCNSSYNKKSSGPNSPDSNLQNLDLSLYNDNDTSLNASTISYNKNGTALNTAASTVADTATTTTRTDMSSATPSQKNQNEHSQVNKFNNLWTKSQTHDADLNPSTGMRGTILSNFVSPQDLITSNFACATTNDSSQTTSSTNSYNSGNQIVSKNSAASTSNNGGRLGKFAGITRVAAPRMSKLRQQIVPILANTTSAVVEKCDDTNQKCVNVWADKSKSGGNDGGNGGSKKYYIGYRRRGADEVDRPAIADVVVRYVRLHTCTIISDGDSIDNSYRHPSSSYNSCVGYKNGNGTENISDKSQNVLDVSNHGNATEDATPTTSMETSSRKDKSVIQKELKGKINSQNAHKGAAALRRGLATGADIAARVAASGSRIIGGRIGGGDTSNNVKSNELDYDGGDVDDHNLSRASSPKLTGKHFSFQNHDDPNSKNLREEGEKIDAVNTSDEGYEVVPLEELLVLPDNYTEWIIPDIYQTLKVPLTTLASGNTNDNSNVSRTNTGSSLPSSPSPRRIIGSREESYISPSPSINTDGQQKQQHQTEREREREQWRARRRMRKTYLFQHRSSPTSADEAGGMGVEAYVDGNTFLRSSPSSNSALSSPDKHRINPWSPVSPETFSIPHTFSSPKKEDARDAGDDFDAPYQEEFMPVIVADDVLPQMYDPLGGGNGIHEYIPVLAIRRQRVGEEERYREDAAVVDIALTFSDPLGTPVMPPEEEIDDDENDENEEAILGKTKWSSSQPAHIFTRDFQYLEDPDSLPIVGLPTILLKHNVPLGFADTPFATRVLDRFPRKDYKGVPLPQEELPMFCYPTGCRLFRAKYQDAPLAECYGFVVKNERGDSIHVSCVSFMEPLTRSKIEQLDHMSERRKKTSLAHRVFCQRKERGEKGQIIEENNDFLSGETGFLVGCKENGDSDTYFRRDNMILTGFDQITTFENKTICLISRYPFWTAFRRFLSHLHILSGSSSDLPLERCISHLLLTVPVPKPGSQCVLVPLPALAGPMVLSMPPTKDLPLLDLPFHRLFSCLDVPTVVTIVIGFLALEKKVIVMSSYPSLVTDVCELLRSLLFPFDLCAPYVPRLTQPFMSCLDFPGAIFVGIHDDGCEDGLAAMVRENIPEDSAIVDLDTGDIDCNGDRYGFLKNCWEIIPSKPRSLLVSEIETLCQDAGIVPGQEPMGIEIEAAFEAELPSVLDEDGKDHLDDRAVRDCFLRFFCSVLGGYERFLVVPDMDFLISGNEWFDTDGFLAASAQNLAGFLSSFVGTQLFQSFIQRRTEASDVHCLLFDECLAQFHSSKMPYGRFGGDCKFMDVDGRENIPIYSLLVDQCATDVYEFSESDEASSAEASFLSAYIEEGFMINNSGDLVTAPSRKKLPISSRYMYCIDGNPCFPQQLDSNMFYPEEPKCLSADFSEVSVPVLTRSEREFDESKRRGKLAVSLHGVQRQRRCLFQLPKLLGSHILGTWLMCIPAQVSQLNISLEHQAKYLLRALGAFCLLRTRQRIVPDEAGYRCLIIACGRAGTDRRVEVVKLFGLLRSDGIFPSAVTLGQYTRAIAEGFSKRSSGTSDIGVGETSGVEVMMSGSSDGGSFYGHGSSAMSGSLNFLDGNIADLEASGRRWRQRKEASNNDREKIEKGDDGDERRVSHQEVRDDEPPAGSAGKEKSRKNQSTKRSQHKPWSPVMCSSSFSPHWKVPIQKSSSDIKKCFGFLLLWSRTTICESCSYIPLDEEIQGGWDEVNKDRELENAVGCPRCGATIHPQLGYSEMMLDDVLSRTGFSSQSKQDEENLPSQIKSSISRSIETSGKSGFVPYLNPSKLRLALEKHVKEYGEEVLERERLRKLDSVVFYNLWWFSARFSLPLPLAIFQPEDTTLKSNVLSTCNWCAFAAWDQSVAEEGCYSAANSIVSFIESFSNSSHNAKETNIKMLSSASTEKFTVSSSMIGTEDFPLLSNFNLQTYSQGDWDHPDLSAILVTLVEACDKRDLRPVIECVLQCNKRRKTLCGARRFELDCYTTILYLARFQCTSAFHRFFPATARGCKGYHFWCANGTVTIFDRLFRDAVDRIKIKDDGTSPEISDITDVALGFRCIFGHII